jgi:hypothetical protein
MALLFHGPSARDTAKRKASGYNLLYEVDGSLGVDEARSVTSVLYTTRFGSKPSCVVLGPLEEASVDALDALLKPLEEPSLVEVFLWAEDASQVRPTVRSRSQVIWCPGNPQDVDEGLENLARETLSALEASRWSLPELVGKTKGKEKDFLRLLVDMISADPDKLPLWEHIRKILLVRNPTFVEILALLTAFEAKA